MPGQQAVHGVGGDALDGVDGGGVAETGRGRGRSRRAAGRCGGCGCLPHPSGHRVADMGDGPAVAVLDPVGGARRSRRSLLRVMITSPTLARFPSAKEYLGSRRDWPRRCARARPFSSATRCRVGAIMIVSNPAARSETQAAKAACVVVVEVADMDAAVIEVEVECLWSAVSEGERCCRFIRVGEAVQLGQVEGAVALWMSRRTPPAPIAASC